MIELFTLGRLELRGPGGHAVQSLLTRPKPLALLAYLALDPPIGHHRRDTVIGLLWPEYPEQRARHALSQVLHALRQGLGEGVVVTRGQEEIGIDRSRLWCDAVAFAEAIEQGNYDAALGLYRGDLLEGFFVSEALGFERWLGSERTRLQELAAGAAWKLARQRIDQGELVEAERAAQRALAMVPTDESEVRRFVEALASAGDRAAAVRFYEKFAQRLKDEYDLEPAPETIQLVEVVRNRTVAAKKSGAAEQSSVPVSSAAAGAGSASQGALQQAKLGSRRPSKIAVQWAAAAAVVVVLTVAVAVGWAARSRTSSALFVPNRVVVAPFENLTGDSSLAPIGLMAADWLTDGLTRTGMVEVITPSAVRQAFRAAERQGTPWSGSSGTLALAESMHAGIAVSGQVFRMANDVQVRAEVVRLPGMSALGTIDPVPVATEDPRAALETVRQRVLGLLAIHLNPRLADWARTVQRPPTYEAYLEFAAGVGGVPDPGAGAGSSRRLERMLRAAAVDTSFMAPLVEGVRWITAYGGDADTRDSLMRVIESRQSFLTAVERYELAAYEATWRRDRNGAYLAMRNAAELAPDRLGELARAAFFDGRYRETVEILERPDRPLGLNRNLGRQRTASLHFLGEHQRELESARRIKQRTPGNMSVIQIEATALAGLGRIDELEAILDEGFLLETGPGGMDWISLFFQAGNELLWHGYEQEGRSVLGRVVAHIRAQPDSLQDKGWLAWSLLFLARYEEARAIYEESVAESEATGESPHTPLAFLAMAAAGMGDRETAQRILAQLRDVEANTPENALNTLRQAQVAGALGDCERAVELLKEALQLGVGHPFIHRRYGLMNCRDYPPFQEVSKPRG